MHQNKTRICDTVIFETGVSWKLEEITSKIGRLSGDNCKPENIYELKKCYMKCSETTPPRYLIT
jgi:hypothetical protein